jgi:hypothetical protein
MQIGLILANWLLIMPSKGIELPVNSVIIIALAIFVLLIIAAFFSKSGGEIDKTQINTAFNQGCSQLSTTYNCDSEKISEVKTSIVENGWAKNLLDVCRMSFNNPTMSAFKCKSACQTCPKRVYDESPCEDNEDCLTPLTPYPQWTCEEKLTVGKVCVNHGLGSKVSAEADNS